MCSSPHNFTRARPAPSSAATGSKWFAPRTTSTRASTPPPRSSSPNSSVDVHGTVVSSSPWISVTRAICLFSALFRPAWCAHRSRHAGDARRSARFVDLLDRELGDARNRHAERAVGACQRQNGTDGVTAALSVSRRRRKRCRRENGAGHSKWRK